VTSIPVIWSRFYLFILNMLLTSNHIECVCVSEDLLIKKLLVCLKFVLMKMMSTGTSVTVHHKVEPQFLWSCKPMITSWRWYGILNTRAWHFPSFWHTLFKDLGSATTVLSDGHILVFSCTYMDNISNWILKLSWLIMWHAVSNCHIDNNFRLLKIYWLWTSDEGYRTFLTENNDYDNEH